MTRATKATRPRPEPVAQTKQEPRLPRTLLIVAVLSLAGVVAAGAVLWNSSGSSGEEVFTGVPFTDPGPIHVHGLGVNPADGSLFIATHTGLFRVGKNERKAVRIADRYQDTMGFSVVGPNRFLGSGHPDLRDEKLPPLLGLIQSGDAGKTWKPMSLLGDADFHVLRSAGSRVYGYDASNDRLLRSTDEGQSWKKADRPAPLVDLAIDPADPLRLVSTATGGFKQGMYASSDGGENWTRLNYAVGLLAWPTPNQLYLVNDSGAVLVSTDGGRRLKQRGDIGGQPAALLGQNADELYVALHDGTVKRSNDGGKTWRVRSSP